jgi:hypothetical protein
MTEPEVHVRSLRRRRSDPVTPPAPRPPNVRNWLIYAGIITLVAGLMLDGSLHHQPEHLPLPKVSYPVEVRSAVSEIGDSLQVVVSWDLTLSEPSGRPDSVLIRVTPANGGRAVVASQAASLMADTLYLAAPPGGGTLKGLSCVAAEHGGSAVDESCAPWQYVRSRGAAALWRGAFCGMESRAVVLRFCASFLLGHIPLRSPRSHQLTPFKDAHQIVHKVFGVAVAVDLV